MKIKQTSPDKIRGKLVKYQLGACLTFKLSSDEFIAAIMTGKFNKYYNLTFIEYLKSEKPNLDDFTNSRFFGTRFGSLENITYAVDQIMVECKYIDNSIEIDSVGKLELLSNFISAGYQYLNNIGELHTYYINELPIRIEKTKNAEKFPEIGFVSKHLIETKYLIQ